MVLRVVIFLIMCKVQLFAQGYSYLSTDSTKVRDQGTYGLLVSENILTEKYGFVDTTGKIVVPHKYDILYPHEEGLAPTYFESKFGFIDTMGFTVIPFEYSTALPFKNGKAIVSKNFRYGVINKENDFVIPIKYNILKTHDHTSYHFQLRPRQSGLMDAKGNVIVPPDYDLMMGKNDSLWIANKDEEFTIFKNDGSLKLPYHFQQMGRKNDIDLIRVQSEGKVGFLNKHYEIAIPPNYSKSALSFGRSVAVYNGEKWGFVDSTNTIIIPFLYDDVSRLSQDKYKITINEKFNIINKEGTFLLDKNCQHIEKIPSSNLLIIDSLLYDINLNKKLNVKVSTAPSLASMSNSRAKIIIEGKQGYVDSVGKLAVPAIYDKGYHFFKDKITAVKQNEKWGFIDYKNKAITKIEYDSVIHIGSFAKGDFLVLKNKKYGFFSGNKMILAPIFDEISTKSDHTLIYRSKNKYGVISRDGQHIKEAIYDEITTNILGFILRIGKNFGFMNKSLEIEIPLSYEYLEHMGYYLFAKKNGRYGTISKTNELIEPFNYDLIEMTQFDMIRIFKDGKVGTLSSKGKELIPPIYDEIRKIDWKNVEVKLGEKTEIFNLFELGDK